MVEASAGAFAWIAVAVRVEIDIPRPVQRFPEIGHFVGTRGAAAPILQELLEPRPPLFNVPAPHPLPDLLGVVLQKDIGFAVG